MNLQQMRYVIAVADHGSFHAAAKKLYISQPSLSHGIKELEQELNTQLFQRTRQGNFLTTSGVDFVRQARKILHEVTYLHRSFTVNATHQRYFSVAGQHYDFIAPLLCDIMAQYPDYQYLRAFESTTLGVIKDVAQYRSELGILFLNDDNRSRLLNLFDQNKLTYTTLGTFATHIFMRTAHPLATKKALTLADLTPYPQVRFAQESAYTELDEDPLDPPNTGPIITTSDRATMYRIINETEAYGAGSGILAEPERQGLVIRPLLQTQKNQLIILTQANQKTSDISQSFMQALRHFFKNQSA